MKDEIFQGCYEVEDGYCGGSRPKYFKIYASDLDNCIENEDDLDIFFEDVMNEDFQEKIYPVAKNRDEFFAWAKEQLDKGDGDGDEK